MGRHGKRIYVAYYRPEVTRNYKVLFDFKRFMIKKKVKMERKKKREREEIRREKGQRSPDIQSCY